VAVPLGLALTVALGAAFVVGVAYPAHRLLRSPRGSPSRIRTATNADWPLLLCLGDSITHGHIGADWVGPLRVCLADRGVLVANGGINGQQVYNLGQRLEADLRCRPAAVVLMIGSNDVMAAERPDRARGYMKGNRLPRMPDLDWSTSELSVLVDRLRARVPHVAVCTIPPLGADPSHPIEPLVARWNAAVREVAGTRGIALLDVHAAIRPLAAASSRPYEGSLSAVLRLMYRSAISHYVLGRSWDAIAQRGGFGATIDGIHLGDAAAARVAALVQAWVEGLGPLLPPPPLATRGGPADA
jgi:acyl-CoA thioesterase I